MNEEELLRSLLHSDRVETAPDQALGVYFSVRRRVVRRRNLRVAAATGTAVCLLVGVLGVAIGVGSGKPPTTAARFGSATGEQRPQIVLTGALESFAGCSAYLNYVKGAAAAVVGPDGLNSPSTSVYFSPADGVGVSTSGGGALNAGVGTSAGVASSGAIATTPASSQSSTYSTTDDQVSGVDEPDTAKTDGQEVVTLSGSVLRVLDTSAHVLGQVDLPGDTSGGFLLDGQYAVVLSTTTPNDGPIGVSDPYLGLQRSPSASASGGPDTARVAIVDLSHPASPTLLRTFEFGGDLVAARLVDGQVRMVLDTNTPDIDFTSPSAAGTDAAATAENKQMIAASTLQQWLPSWQVEQPDGATSARTPLASCTAVSRPPQSSGVSTATVFALDPSSTSPDPALSVVAGGNTVYATADQVYLAGPVTTPADPEPYANAQQSGCCSIVPPASAATRIYEFSFNSSGPPSFDGAGTVPGWLVNSYAMDQDPAGRLRVASTASTATPSSGSDPYPGSPSTQSYITILAAHNGSLTTVGSVGGLGPNEFIRAVRFIGNQAYVVTYQTFDPLYIVDLSNPAEPKLAGHLDEPGFSEFLYPVSNKILLGVGVQITGGEPSGYVLSTYDVSDPAKPVRIDSKVLVSGYQYVGQGYDPHAFLYWAPDGVAFVATPQIASNYSPPSGATDVAAYRVSPSGQLTSVATLGHPNLSADRTVVVAGSAWAVTSGGVVVAPLTSLGSSSWAAYP